MSAGVAATELVEAEAGLTCDPKEPNLYDGGRVPYRAILFFTDLIA